MAALIILILLVGLGAASALGWTTDSRDPEYGVGPVITTNRHARETGTN